MTPRSFRKGDLRTRPETVPLGGYDSTEKKAYLNININIEETISELKTAFGKSLPFAVDIGYISDDTINFLLQKAGRHELALENLSNTSENKSGEVN